MSAFSFNGLSRVLTLRGFAIGMAVFLVLFAAYQHGKRVGGALPYYAVSVSWIGHELPEGVGVSIECGKYRFEYPEPKEHKH